MSSSANYFSLKTTLGPKLLTLNSVSCDCQSHEFGSGNSSVLSCRGGY